MLTLNPYRIGFRTLKTAVGITLGVILAKWIGLITMLQVLSSLFYVLNILRFTHYKQLVLDSFRVY